MRSKPSFFSSLHFWNDFHSFPNIHICYDHIVASWISLVSREKMPWMQDDTTGQVDKVEQHIHCWRTITRLIYRSGFEETVSSIEVNSKPADRLAVVIFVGTVMNTYVRCVTQELRVSLYPRPTKLEGVYWIHLVHPSVRPSVCLETTWFPEHKSSLLWNFNFKFHMHVDGGHWQKPIDFQRSHFQNGRLAAILFFLVSRL